MFNLDIFLTQDAKTGLHLDIRGLEPGRIATFHIKTPNRVGLASFIGTDSGAKPVSPLSDSAVIEPTEEEGKN